MHLMIALLISKHLCRHPALLPVDLPDCPHQQEGQAVLLLGRSVSFIEYDVNWGSDVPSSITLFKLKTILKKSEIVEKATIFYICGLENVVGKCWGWLRVVVIHALCSVISNCEFSCLIGMSYNFILYNFVSSPKVILKSCPSPRAGRIVLARAAPLQQSSWGTPL